MKTTIITYILLPLLLLMVSCASDTDARWDSDQQEVLITIAPGTRASDYTDYSKIRSLRVLGYHALSGRLAFNAFVDNLILDDGTAITEHQITVNKGTFTFVFIANEERDTDLHNTLEANGISISDLYYLKRQAFSYTAFSNATLDDIPMVHIVENVKVNGDNDVIIDNDESKHYTTVWPVEMERLGVKVRLHLLVPKTDPLVAKVGATDDPLCVYFNNLPTQVFLFPETDNSANQASYINNNTHPFRMSPLSKRDDITTHPLDPDEAIPSDQFYYGSSKYISNTNVIILPESFFLPASQEAKGVELTIVTSTNGLGERKGKIVVGSDYALTRNTFLDVRATIEDGGIQFTTTIADWDDSYTIEEEL